MQALPYHLKVSRYFKQQTKTWEFFASAKTREDQLGKYKTELLKNTYKFDPVADATLYNMVETAKEKLNMPELPVTLYQAQYTDETNATVVFINNEVHIVFSGRIVQLLDEEEMLAVIAHELMHVKLYNMLDGDLETADRIIMAIASNYNSEASYYETARLYRLYTEIFCDRGAYSVLQNINPLITSLVKTATGLEKVNAETYLKQAEEIFSVESETVTNSQISHPENFIRARAIYLWHTQQETAEDEIIKMIEGVTDIDKLDLFKQNELSELTRQFVQLFLKPKWFRSVMVMSQARQYFTSFAIDDDILLNEKLIDTISQSHSSVKNYLCYVLLDFILIDPALELVPFGWGFQFAEDVGIKDQFDTVVKYELKLSDKKLHQHKEKALASYYEVKEGADEQIYEDR